MRIMPPSEPIHCALVVQVLTGARGAADESGCGPAAAYRAIRSGVRKEKWKQAAGSAGLRLIGIGIGKAGVEIKVHGADPFRVTQSRRAAKTAQIVFPGKALEDRHSSKS